MLTLQLAVTDMENMRAVLKQLVMEVLTENENILEYQDTSYKEVPHVARNSSENSRLRFENEKQYLTRKQVKELLHVSYQTLNNWKKIQKLVPFKISGKILYDFEDVQSAMQKQNPNPKI